MRALVAQGADLNFQNVQDGMSAAHYAGWEGHKEVSGGGPTAREQQVMGTAGRRRRLGVADWAGREVWRTSDIDGSAHCR